MKREARSGALCEITVVQWRFRGAVQAQTESERPFVGDRNGTI